MDLREALTALRARWWLPFIGLILGGAAAFGLTFVQPPLYTSSTELFVSTTDNTTTSDALSGSQFSEQRVTSYARLIAGEELAGRVISRLGLSTTPKQLSSEITATPILDTVLIDVTVTDRSPSQAQRIASAVGTEFSSMANELEATYTNGASPVKVTVTQQPDLPTVPSSPQTLRYVAIGLLVGLLVGAATAVTRELLDKSVKGGDVAANLAGAPLLSVILRDSALEKRHTIDRDAAKRVAEDFRRLCTNLQFLDADEPPTVVMVSSAVPGEGKTTMVVNLGLALAEAGKTVTIVEADLRQPKVTSYLSLVNGAGLTNVLMGSADLDDVTQVYRDGLSVIAAGPLPPNPGKLLASDHMATVLEKLRAQNDFVLIDAAPLLPVADSSGLAIHVDGVLLSVKYGSTRKEQLRQAAASLAQVGATAVGVVLNIVPPKAEVANAHGAGYDYGYRYVDAPTTPSEAMPPRTGSTTTVSGGYTQTEVRRGEDLG